MTRDHLAARARRVLVGLDDEGRSTIVSDAPTEARLATEAFTRNLIWGGDVVPTPVMAGNAVEDAATIPPPPTGYYYDISTFPPDSEWDFEAGYAQALAEAGVDEPAGEDAVPGMHQTDSIDVVTVISGEIWAVVETGETLMKPGDTIIQRGTRHAWRNRSDAPCTVAALHVSVVR
jgi:mannose-6-phosphate isomerase-like protein (cupin superfamily)